MTVDGTLHFLCYDSRRNPPLSVLWQ